MKEKYRRALINNAYWAKHIFFVPFRQDDWVEKPNSVVADFDFIPETVENALKNRQIQPVLRQIQTER